MTAPCETARQRLDALADGELSHWRAWGLRRHLARCPACASDLTAILRLTSRVRAWRDVAAPSEFRQSAPASSRRPLWQLALAGCAAAAAVVALLLPGQPVRPTLAYADVERAMQRVKTAHWVETTTRYNDDGRVSGGVPDVSDHWLRLDPPALSVHGLSGPSRDYQDVMDGRGDRRYDPISHKCTLHRAAYEVHTGGKVIPVAATDPFARRVMWDTILPPKGFDDPQFAGALNATNPDGAFVVWRARAVSVAGRRLIEFHSEYRPKSRRSGEGMVRTFWADPMTHLLVRREDQVIDPQTGRLVEKTEGSQYRYDETPPPGAFELQLPPGTKVIRRE